MILTCLTIHEVDYCIKIFSWNQDVRRIILKRWMATKFGWVLIDCYLNSIVGFNTIIILTITISSYTVWVENLARIKIWQFGDFADDAKLKYKNHIASYKSSTLSFVKLIYCQIQLLDKIPNIGPVKISTYMVHHYIKESKESHLRCLF